MKVTEITVRRVLGLREARLEAGTVTRFVGGNGTGKTSHLEAIRVGLTGGDLARLQTIGTQEDGPPEVVLVLDGGRFRVERKGKKARVLARVGDSAAYKEIDVPPQRFLDGIFDVEGCNPVRLLTAKPDDFARMLLEALTLDLDVEKLLVILRTAAGLDLSRAPIDVTRHPLEVLAAARDFLYNERTGVNRSAKDKASSAYELRKTVPAVMLADPSKAAEDLQSECDRLRSEIEQVRAEARVTEERGVELAKAAREEAVAIADGELRASKERLAAHLARAEAEANAFATAAMAELEKKRAETVETLRANTRAAEASETEARVRLAAEADLRLESARAAAAEARTAAESGVAQRQAALDSLIESLGTLRAQARDWAGITERKNTAEKFERESDSLKERSASLTSGIDAVDELQCSMVSAVPIEGKIEFREGRAYLDGVPFEQVNRERQTRIAVQVALLRANPELPAVFVDNADALDLEHQAMLEAECRRAGAQLFVARVEDEGGPLRVEVEQ